MSEEKVRISPKNQIVIPKGARRKLGLSAGDELIVRVDRELLVMKPKPHSYSEYMQGLHKGVWKTTDVSSYVEKERRAWSTEKPTSAKSSRSTKR